MDLSALIGVLASEWGYLGIFFAQLISYATIILPLPGIALVFFYGAVLNPFLVGLFAAFGAAFGELVGYGAGYGGNFILTRRDKAWAKKTKDWFKKYNPFFVILALASIPFPFDVVGILCGLLRYDVRKFWLAVFTGNFIKLTVVALGGFYGLHWVLKFFGGA
ncbi:MAG: VTT domain-containing protein [Candidatus Aenigmatarchaeota archaeon]